MFGSFSSWTLLRFVCLTATDFCCLLHSSSIAMLHAYQTNRGLKTTQDFFTVIKYSVIFMSRIEVEVQICVVSDCLIVVTWKIDLFSAMIYDIGCYFYSQASVQSVRKVCMMLSANSWESLPNSYSHIYKASFVFFFSFKFGDKFLFDVPSDVMQW